MNDPLRIHQETNEGISQVVQSDADAGKSMTEIKGPATVFASVTWMSEDIVCTKMVVSSEMS